MANQIQAAVIKGRGMFGRAGKIGVPIMALLGALSDAAEPLGPFSFIFAVGLMALAIAATVLNHLVSRRRFDAAASDGTISDDDRVVLAQGSAWAAVAAFSVVGSLFCWILVGLQQVASEGERGVLASNIVPIARLQESLLGLQQDVTAIRDTTARTENKVDSLSGDVRRASDAMESVAEAVASLGRSGGIIANPSTAPECFHNAITYEQAGQPEAARAAYAEFAEFDLDAIDAFERYAQLVRVQDGRQAAREMFDSLSRRLESVAIKLVAATQCEGVERTRRLEDLAQKYPSYPPLFHALAADQEGYPFTATRLRRHASALESFIASGQRGDLLAYYINHQTAAQRLQSAQTQLASLQPQLAVYGRPPQINSVFLPEGKDGGGKWQLMVSIVDMPTRLYYRLGKDSEWVDTGSSAPVNPISGKPLANMSFRIDALQPSCAIELKYEDAEGQVVGPLQIAWEDGAVQLRRRAKRQCEEMPVWLVVPDAIGTDRTEIDLSNLLRNCCAIDSIHYSVNSRSLDKSFPVPSCSQPWAPCSIEAARSKLTIDVHAPESFDTLAVELRYFDGTSSGVREFSSPSWVRRQAGGVELSGLALSDGVGVSGIGVTLIPPVEYAEAADSAAQIFDTTNAAGKFNLDAKRAGSYLARLHVPREWSRGSRKPVGVIRSVWIYRQMELSRLGRVEQNIELPPGSLAGRITGEGGQPVRNQRVILSSTGAVPMGTTVGRYLAEVETDREGRYEFRWIPNGTYTVFAARMQLGVDTDLDELFSLGQPFMEAVEVRDSANAQNLDLQLASAGILRGIVRDAQGEPSGASVLLWTASGTPICRRSVFATLPQSRGYFSCGPLLPGEYLVSALTATQASPAITRVVVEPGQETQVELALGGATMLVIEWEKSPESPMGADVLVTNSSGLQVNGFQRKDDAFEREKSTLLHSVGPLPPGSYSIRLTGRDGREATEQVQLTGEPESRVRIRL